MFHNSCFGKSILALTLMGAALAVSCAPGLAATLTGQVTDADTGAPLPFANVLLNGETAVFNTRIRLGVLGDDSGGYRFNTLPAGRYEIRFVYVGYREHLDSLEVALDDDITLDVALTPDPIEIPEIVVEADRLAREREVQTGLINLDAATIDAMPAIGEPDPIRSLQFLPGVQAASDLSSGLYIRGGGPDQTLVLFDQAPVYNPTHAFGLFSTFNSDAVDDVTLYKGAYPAEYGGRLGAVVDIRSRETDAPEIRGKGSISTIAARLMLEGPVGLNNVLVSGRRTYLEPILAGLRRGSPEIPHYYFYDLNGKLSTKRGAGWAVFSGYTGRDRVRFEPDGDTRVEIDWGNTVLSAKYSRLLAESVLAKWSLSGSEYESVTDARIFNTPFEIDNRLRDLTARAEIDWEQSPNNRIGVGIQASAYDARFDQQFNKDRRIGFDSNPLELVLYVNDMWSARTGTSITTGLRTRYITDGDRILLEPRFAGSQLFDGGFRLKVGGGIYSQYLQLIATEGLSAADIYVPIDETADPGRSWQAVVGLDWELSRRYQFTMEGYYNDLENLVAFNNDVPVDQDSFNAADLFYTGGTGYATGVEFFAQRRLGNLTGWMGYTLGWSRRNFAQLNAGETFPPKYDRRHDVNVVANYRTGPWSYGLAFVYGTGQAFTPASARYRLQDPALGDLTTGTRLLPGRRNSERLLPYHRLDVSVTRDFVIFGRGAQWFVQAFNLYSRRNEWFVQFDEVGTDVEVVRQLPVIPSIGLNFTF